MSTTCHWPCANCTVLGGLKRRRRTSRRTLFSGWCGLSVLPSRSTPVSTSTLSSVEFSPRGSRSSVNGVGESVTSSTTLDFRTSLRDASGSGLWLLLPLWFEVTAIAITWSVAASSRCCRWFHRWRFDASLNTFRTAYTAAARTMRHANRRLRRKRRHFGSGIIAKVVSRASVVSALRGHRITETSHLTLSRSGVRIASGNNVYAVCWPVSICGAPRAKRESIEKQLQFRTPWRYCHQKTVSAYLKGILGFLDVSQKLVE